MESLFHKKSPINISILMFFKEMPKIKKRRNVGFVNLRNFKGFRRENSEGEIAQTYQISELRDIPIEIRPDSICLFQHIKKIRNN